MEEYRFTRLNDRNLADLAGLYLSAFNVRVSKEYLSKKYNTEQFGLKYVGYIAYAPDGTAAAYYGVFPMILEYGGQKILAAQSGDTMTHANHRGKQLFTKLAKATYQLAREEGIEFVFGFPNKNSYPGFVKHLDWQIIGEMESFVIRVPGIPLNAVAKRWGIFSPAYQWLVKKLLRGYTTKRIPFGNSLAAPDKITVRHDLNYLNYRSFSKNYILDLGGKLCWVKLEGNLFVGDIDRMNHDEFIIVLKKLKSIARITGSIKIVFLFSPESPWKGMLLQHAELQQGLPIGYVNFRSSLDLNKLAFTLADADTF